MQDFPKKQKAKQCLDKSSPSQSSLVTRYKCAVVSVSPDTACIFLFPSYFIVFWMFLGVSFWAVMRNPQPITVQGQDYKNIAAKLHPCLFSLS